jgi:hypothetical protein
MRSESPERRSLSRSHHGKRVVAVRRDQEEEVAGFEHPIRVPEGLVQQELGGQEALQSGLAELHLRFDAFEPYGEQVAGRLDNRIQERRLSDPRPRHAGPRHHSTFHEPVRGGPSASRTLRYAQSASAAIERAGGIVPSSFRLPSVVRSAA